MALSRVFSRPKMLSQYLIRPIRSVHHVKVHADESHIAPPTHGHKCYPFLVKGCPKETRFAKTDERGQYLRIDMPGVKQEGLKLTLKGSTLFFEGDAPVDPEFGDFETTGRKYGGSFEFFPAENVDLDNIQCKISAGVLRLFVPHKNFEHEISGY
ncbi:hypothetical protein CCACVL1_24685 [Corchorus capsularis]|uniref:SHSP domain-containing protein n=1 Tax=Corchorus capsularis TaxID=210143 RepID=A0A1R3GNP2_COCAP|nr:hypothetical protein CCACVL1_24685 [Corchorus capsularis]